jgi:hypothetical protein
VRALFHPSFPHARCGTGVESWAGSQVLTVLFGRAFSETRASKRGPGGRHFHLTLLAFPCMCSVASYLTSVPAPRTRTGDLLQRLAQAQAIMLHLKLVARGSPAAHVRMGRWVAESLPACGSRGLRSAVCASLLPPPSPSTRRRLLDDNHPAVNLTSPEP